MAEMGVEPIVDLEGRTPLGNSGQLVIGRSWVRIACSGFSILASLLAAVVCPSASQAENTSSILVAHSHKTSLVTGTFFVYGWGRALKRAMNFSTAPGSSGRTPSLAASLHRRLPKL